MSIIEDNLTEDIQAAPKDKTSERGQGRTEGHTKNIKKKFDTWDVEEAPSAPLKVHRVQYEQLNRLATMPRRRRNEYFLSAFWATVTATTPAVSGYFDIMSDRPINKGLDLVELITLSGCIVSVILSLFSASKSETSEEYLNTICDMRYKATPD